MLENSLAGGYYTRRFMILLEPKRIKLADILFVREIKKLATKGE